MNLKWIGAIFILSSCGGFAIWVSAEQRREERLIKSLLTALDYMECELQYRLTPLPDLCRQAAQHIDRELYQIFLQFSDELESKLSPDVYGCMMRVLSASQPLPEKTANLMRLMGNSLGRFDLEGQLKGLESLRGQCREELQKVKKYREEKQQSCQTLCLCAGAALVILFI